MAERYQSASAVLGSIRERLASARMTKPAEILEGIADALAKGRGYAWAGIYLAVENHGVYQAASGSSRITPAESEEARPGEAGDGVSLDEIKAELAAPIRLGARTLGLIVVETSAHSRAKAAREWGPRNATSTNSSPKAAFGPARQERVLIQQTAKLVAQYLTTDRAKQLLRKTREQARDAAAVQPHKSPQPARPVVRRAAAGERISR